MFTANRSSVVMLAGLFALAGDRSFGDEFDFRDADRPTFEKRLSVAELLDKSDVIVLDVRLSEDFESDPQLIPGALRRDPELISAWASDLPVDKSIVTYCVRGKWVSQKAATYLEAQGFNVRSLEGGIEAWKASTAGDEDSKSE